MNASDSEQVRQLRKQMQWHRQEIVRLQIVLAEAKQSADRCMPYEEALLGTSIPILENHSLFVQKQLPSYAIITQLSVSHLPPSPGTLLTDSGQTEILTSREWQVIWLIGRGHSNKAIAKELHLGYSTIKNYVSNILKKLQLDGRTQVALLAQQWSGEQCSPLPRTLY